MKNRLAEFLQDHRPIFAFTLITGIMVFLYWDVLFPLLVDRVPAFGTGSSLQLHAYSGWRPILCALIFLVPLGFYLSRSKPLRNNGEPAVRNILGICALLITWQLAGDGYNFYLNSWYVADRLLMVVLAALVFYSIAAVPLFLLISLSFYSQFFHPFDWLYTYDIRPVFNILIIGYAIAVFRPGRQSSRLFFTLVLLMQMGSYLISGVGKLVISGNIHAWFTENELFLLPLGTHLAGWWHSKEWIMWPMASALEILRLPVALYVFLIEILCLFAMRNDRYAKLLLFSLCWMHIVIAFMTGIFFWYWFLINAVLLIVLFRHPGMFLFRSGPGWWIRSGVLVGMAFIVFHPIYYAWHDARYRWIVDLKLIDSTGKAHVLNKNRMSGYSYYFTHAEFQHLIDKRIGSNNGYSASLREVRRFREADGDDIHGLLDTIGMNHFDPGYHAQVADFLRTYFNHYNQHPDRRNSLAGLPVLRQLYMYRHDTDFLEKDLKVERVQLVLREYLYLADSGFASIGETIILDASVPD